MTTIDKTRLRDIETFNNAIDLLHEVKALTDDQVTELTGFGLMPGNHKEKLVGVPFVIIEFDFRIGNENSRYVECSIITTRDSRYLLRDSSRGICAQLTDLYNERVASDHPNPNLGYYARKGLTFQEFPYTKPNGEYVKPRTYYLS